MSHSELVSDFCSGRNVSTNINAQNDKKSLFSLKHAAFTLSEVLITLGVIGVVAAITLPVLIKNYQKKITIEKLKTAYSQLSQAIKMSEIDNGFVSEWDFPDSSVSHADGVRTFSEKYIAPYFKSIDICDYRNNYCNSGSSAYKIILANGSEINISRIGNGIMQIGIYINGDKSTKQGRDKFILYIHKEAITGFRGEIPKSGLHFAGEGLTRTQLKTLGDMACSPDTQKTYRGFNCGALILLDGWKISDDYPW